MSPELAAILGVGVALLGVGVALAALMFHVLRRMEERLRQDMQRSEERLRQELQRSEERGRQETRESEERGRKELRESEERTRQEIRESEARVRNDLRRSEERTDSRFTSLDGRFASPGSARIGDRGTAGEGRRAAPGPPRRHHRPPDRLNTAPRPNGTWATAAPRPVEPCPAKQLNSGHAVTATTSVPCFVTSRGVRESGCGCTPGCHRARASRFRGRSARRSRRPPPP